MKIDKPNPTSSSSPAPRRWRRWGLISVAFAAVAGLTWWLLTGGASSGAVTVQAQPPAGQSTPASTAAPLVDQSGATPTGADQPITTTIGAPGVPPATRPGRTGNAAATTPAAASASASSAPSATKIAAVTGLSGATIQPADGGAPVQVSAGRRLTLLARSSDGHWLLATDDAVSGWVRADGVVAFNTARLPIQAGAPPVTAAEASNPVAATAAITTTEAPAATAATPASSAPPAGSSAGASAAMSSTAPLTAQMDADKTRGLNVRAGPGAAYAKRGLLVAGDVVSVVGRTADSSWLEVTAAQLDGGSGWAAAYYLVLDGDIRGLPVSAPETAAAAPAMAADAAVVQAVAPAVTDTESSATQQVPTGGMDGTLVFQSHQGGAISAYDLDNGRLWALTSGFDPAISPDGQTVAFTRQGDDGGLYLIDIDGGNERRIYTGPRNIASPKWSADGSELVFSYAVSSLECRDMGPGRCAPDSDFQSRPLSGLDPNDYPLITKYEYDLGVVAADGSNFHSLSALPSSRTPDWNAAGIVYQSTDGIQMIQDTPGASSQVVTYDMLQPAYQDPDWQPGGGRILFQKQGASHWEIWAVDPNGGNMVALTQPQTVLVAALPSNVAPAWSPDGSQIVFLSNRTAGGEAGAWRLWVMDADGRNQRQLPIETTLDYTFGAEQMVSWGRLTIDN